jgi:predicted dehydrogenase
MSAPDAGGVLLVAVVGCGLIGRKRALGLPPGARVSVVADLDRSRAEALAAILPYPVRVATSAAEAVGDGQAQLAIVATQHSALAPATLEAIQAGCHVLVEKPGAHRLADLLAVQAAARAGGRVVKVGFNHRFHPSLLRARELIASGAYGDLMYVRGRYGHGGRPGYEQEWRADRARSGGGELLDQGIHLIDLTRYLVGEVDLAFSECRTDFWAADVEDNAYLALRPRAGGFAWLHASWTEWKNLFCLEVAFRDAKLEINGLGGSYGTERLALYEMLPEMGPPGTTIWEWPQADRSFERETVDVLGALQGEASLGADLQDCIAAFRIVEEAYAR